MKFIKLLVFTCGIAFAPLLKSMEQPMDHRLQKIDDLITYLAQGNVVKNITALNNLTCARDISFVAQQVALMRAAGLVVEESKIENLMKIDQKYTELLATLKACAKFNAPYAEQTSMPQVQEELEQLEHLLINIRQVIGLCAPENTDETITYALDIVQSSEVSDEIKKAFVERVKQVHDTEEVHVRCDALLAKIS